MIRWALLSLGALAGAAVVVASTVAQTGVKATLTSHVPLTAEAGTHFILTWKINGPRGHAYDPQGVFVRVVCPEGDVVTKAFATVSSRTNGAYRAVVTVPAGGIGVISIGAGKPPTYFPITNKPRR